MASLIDIRRRLRSVKSTQQITKAMKMVAAAKLRRAQERVIGARPYAKLLREVLASVSRARRGREAPAPREPGGERRVIVVVVAGDRGLAGAFNTNVNRATAHLLACAPEWTRGAHSCRSARKPLEYWKRRKYPLHREDLRRHLRAAEVLGRAGDRRVSGGGVPRGADRRRLHRRQRVPLDPVAGRADRNSSSRSRRPEEPVANNAEEKATPVDYLYEPDAKTILAWLLPRYLEFTVFRALAESAAAEMGARMTAMDSASKNAGDMID